MFAFLITLALMLSFGGVAAPATGLLHAVAAMPDVVAPHGARLRSRAAGRPNVVFDLRNATAAAALYRLSCQSWGAVGSCRVPRPVVRVPAGATAPVAVGHARRC